MEENIPLHQQQGLLRSSISLSVENYEITDNGPTSIHYWMGSTHSLIGKESHSLSLSLSLPLTHSLSNILGWLSSFVVRIAQSVELSPMYRKVMGSIPGTANSAYE